MDKETAGEALRRERSLSPLRLGQLLLRHRLVSAEELSSALTEQESGSDLRLGELLVQRGAIDKSALAEALGEQFGISVVYPNRASPTREALASLPREAALQLQALPLRHEDDRLIVAVGGPPTPELRDVLARSTGSAIRCVLAPADLLSEAIALWYSPSTDPQGDPQPAFGSAPSNVDRRTDPVAADHRDVGRPSDLSRPRASGEPRNEAPRRSSRSEPDQIVAWLLSQAIRSQATAIHLESEADGLLIRHRVNGTMQDDVRLPRFAGDILVHRLLQAADLDPASTLPLETTLQADVLGTGVAARVIVAETLRGPKFVIQIEDRDRTRRGLGDLGLPDNATTALREAVGAPRGLVVIAGPPGSGRTTTLYALIAQADPRNRSVATIEEPAGCLLPDTTQLRIDPEQGFTRATAFRAAAALDPDVLVIDGPVDHVVISAAVNAVLRDRLVLMSIDAVDVGTAIARLVESVDRLLVASTLSLVVAQRLVDRVSHGASPTSTQRGTASRPPEAVAVAEALAITESVRNKILAYPEPGAVGSH